MSQQHNYKIVPALEKSIAVRIQDLRMYLAANISVHCADGDLNKAAQFQQHLDLVDLLVKCSQGHLPQD